MCVTPVFKRSGLSHCRHLKTVRTHLSGLVHSPAVSMVSPTDASTGLTADIWQQMRETGLVCVSLFSIATYGTLPSSTYNNFIFFQFTLELHKV